MRDPKLLLLTLILLVGATGVQSQFDFNNLKNNVKNWGEGAGQDIQNWFKEAGDKIRKFKDKAMEKFMDNLPEKVKEWIGKGDYKNASVTDLLESMPPKAWNAMKLGQLTSMGKDKFDKLIQDGANKIPPRVLNQLRKLQTLNKTREEVVMALKQEACRMGEMGPRCTLTKPILMAYMTMLGNPKDFTKENITTTMGRSVVLNFLPPVLMKISNKTVLKEVKTIMDTCTRTNPSDDCPSTQMSQGIVKMLNMKIFGKPNTWTRQNITDMGGVLNLDPRVLKMLPDQTLKDIKGELKQREFAGPREYGMAVRALARAEGVEMMDDQNVTTWVDGLGDLKEFVLPSDVPNVNVTNQQVVDNAKRLANSGQLTAKDGKMILKSMLRSKSVDNMTEAEVNTLGNLLSNASPNLIKKLINKGTLKGNTLKSLGTSFVPSGPGSEAKGRTLLDAIEKDTPNLSDLPKNLMPYLSAGQVNTMPTNDLEAYLNEIKAKQMMIPEAQKQVFINKIPPSNVPISFRGMMSMSDYSSLNNNQLKTFSEGLPPNSPPNLLVAKEAFGSVNNITASVIKSNMQVAHLISAADAKKIHEGDIVTVLEDYSTLRAAPSMDVCRILKDKLVMYYKNEDVAGDEEEVAQAMTPDEVEKTPPCVMAALGKEALEGLNPEAMTILFNNLGKVNNSMSIIRSIRQLIVESGLKAMGDMDMIGMNVIDNLGTAALDLDDDALVKLDPDAAFSMVSKLQEMYASQMMPCLGPSQKEEIAKLIEKVKGEPSTWSEVKDVCCLLPLLSSSMLSRIPDDVLPSCTCEPNVEGFEDYIDARESLCKSDIGEGEMKKSMEAMEEVKEKQIEAELRTIYDLNARRRRKRAAEANACDIAAVAGATELNENEVKSMTNESVLQCMFELTQEKLDESMARTVFERIMLAKNNMLDTLTTAELVNLQYAWAGIKAEEVTNLSLLTYDTDDDVVREMGRSWDLDEDVLMALASKVATEWRLPNVMESKDLQIMNQLICGLNVSTVNTIQNDVVLGAMFTVTNLEDCPDKVIQALAAKVVAAYGDVDEWDAAKVNEMGSLVGGMSPETLMKIPNDSFNGLSVRAMESIPPESISVLKVGQIENLPSTSALAVSDEQMSKFNPEMRAALQNILSHTDSGATGVTTSLIMSLVVGMAVLMMV